MGISTGLNKFQSNIIRYALRYSLITIWLLLVFAAHAQLTLTPIYRTYGSETIQPNQVVAETTLELPFWEDFSTTANGAPDSALWAFGANVFVNASMGQHPPTYRVATLDGMQSTGLAYDIENEFSAATDSLISQPIDLTLVAPSNRGTVYMSFFWQAGGFGEMPDDNDSLVLYFSKPAPGSTIIWDKQWSKVGGIDNALETFTQEILPIDNSAYFHDQFQFKFVAYTSQRGQFDSWHLDYIYLNEYRGPNSLSHRDRAMTGVASSLLSPYFSIPAQHFFKNPDKYYTSQTIEVSCLEDQFHGLVFFYNLENLTSGEDYGLSVSRTDGIIEAYEIRTVSVPNPASISIPAQEVPLDSQVIRSRFYYETGDKHLFEQVIGTDTIFLEPNLKVNDTVTNEYLLHNYYAYDDGVAEFAAGVNELYGQVAVMFVLEEPDTLTHIDVYFPNIAPDSEGVGIDMLVWSRLEDQGVRTRQAFSIAPPEKRDTFTRIRLREPQVIKDTLYIGYEQNVDDYVGIGFDKNNAIASDRIFFNVEGVWQSNNDISGALMLRAVFDRDTSYVLGTEPALLNLRAYPNPSNGMLTIEGSFDQLVIMDLLGRTVFISQEPGTYDLSFLKDGIYLAKIVDSKSVSTQKIVIQK